MQSNEELASIVKDASREGVREELENFGFCVNNKLKTQQDLAFLTKLRENREKMGERLKQAGALTIVGVLITATIKGLGFKIGQ